MRRGVGIGAIQARQKLDAAAKDHGSALTADRMEHVESQIAAFEANLAEFARKYRTEINKNPEFRRAFARMTTSIGVDPLASSKGFWGKMLGVGDFYYELGVQIVDVCFSTRASNGGLISLSELTVRLSRMRGGASARAASSAATASSAAAGSGASSSAAAAGSKHERITSDDVLKAIEKLAVMGGGYRIVRVGAEPYVVSVPYELNADQTLVLQFCSRGTSTAATGGAGASSSASASVSSSSSSGSSSSAGWVTVSTLCRGLGWDRKRGEGALAALLREGMAWLDTGNPEYAADGPRYYFPAVLAATTAAAAAASA